MRTRLAHFIISRTRRFAETEADRARCLDDSRFIWDGADLNGYAPLVSNAVPSTLTKGSSSGICSAIIFGNFNDYAIGFWAGLSLELIRDSANAKVGMHTLVANSYYDGAVLRPASFAAMKDALTTGESES